MREVDGPLQALLGDAFTSDDVADFYASVAAGVLFGSGSSKLSEVLDPSNNRSCPTKTGERR